jgi:hypothetical protein
MPYKSLFATTPTAPAKTTTTPKKTGYMPLFKEGGVPVNQPANPIKPEYQASFGEQSRDKGVYAEAAKRATIDTRKSEMAPVTFDLMLKPYAGTTKTSTPAIVEKTDKIKKGEALRGEITPQALTKLKAESDEKLRQQAREYLTKDPRGKFDVAQGATVDSVVASQKELMAGGALMAIGRVLADVNPESKFASIASKLSKIDDVAETAKLLKNSGLKEEVVSRIAPIVSKEKDANKISTLIKNNKTTINIKELDEAENSFKIKLTEPKPGGIERATKEIQEGSSAPVRVRQLEDGRLTIEDGRHRVEAYKRLGVKEIPYEDVTGFYNKGKKIGDFKVQTKTVPEKILEYKGPIKSEERASKLIDARGKIKQKAVKELPGGFELPDETILSRLQKTFQDNMERLKVTQKSITSSGAKISEEADALLKQRLFIGKASDKINRFRTEVVEPLAISLKKSGIDIDEMGEYMMARHASERNTRIKELFDKDNGSGLSSEVAEAFVKNFEKQKGDSAAKFANDFYNKVTKKTVSLLHDNGIINNETAKALDEGYKNYVPLKGKDGVPTRLQTGQGFDVKGTGIKRAFGRDSKAQNPFVQAILDHESAIIRVEKNEVLKSFKKLVEQNPNESLWNVEKVKFIPKYDETGELLTLDPRFKPNDNTLQLYEDGKMYLINIKDPALAQSMKNLGVQKSYKILNDVNNYLRAINTTLNPEFLLTNFSRDIQTAAINIGTEQSARMARNVVKDVPAAIRGIWKEIRGKGLDNEWSKEYAELKKFGGKTGYFDFKDLSQREKDLTTFVKTYNGDKAIDGARRVIVATGNFISDMNEAVEMGVRLSAFKNAKNAGVSVEKAAALAKNLTVDFNRKGNWSTALNSLYLFFNAGVQGSARILSAAKNNPKRFAKVVTPIIASAFGLAEMNRKMNEKAWNDIPETTKNKNLIIMKPDGTYYKLPLPYGYNIFKIIGDVVSDSINGVKKPSEIGARIINALDNSFNPLSSGSLGQMISPTITDPIVQQAENKNYEGKPIAKEQSPYGAEKKDSSMYWESVRPQSKAVTDWLNEMTGGNDVEAGGVDINPELVDHWFDFFTGGVGRTANKLWATGINLKDGKVPTIENAPFINKFIGTPTEFANNQAIRKIEKKSASKELDSLDKKRLKESLKEELELGKMTAEDAIKTLKAIERGQDKIIAGRVLKEIKGKTKEEKLEAVNALTPSQKKELIGLLKSRE